MLPIFSSSTSSSNLIAFSNSLGPDQAQQNASSDLELFNTPNMKENKPADYNKII